MANIKRLSTTVGIGLCSLLLTPKEVSAFTFTQLADTTDRFSSLGFFPSINDAGTVVFSAELQAGGSGIFTSSSGAITTIVDTNGPFSLFAQTPVINDQNIIAFRANLDTIGSGIFTSSSGAITTIAESQQPRGVFGDPAINNRGAVVFPANQNDPNAAGSSILISQGESIVTIVDSSGPFSFFEEVTINDNAVAFSAVLDDGSRGIFINRDAETTTIVNTNSDFSFLANPVINDSNTVAFNGVLQAVRQGIYTVSDGKTTTIVDNSDAFQFFENPSINNTGTVAFKGVLDTGLCIFTSSNSILDDVVAVGDSLADSEVTDLFLSNQGLNDRNQIVFYAKLANGTSGIFRADPEPIPEPTSVLGLLTAGVLGVVLRWKQHYLLLIHNSKK